MGVTFIAPQGTYTAPAKLVTKEITENGTYDATDDSANGYSSVTVNVEGGGGSSDLTWILPEQTVTLVDQPVEITGLRLDLITTAYVPLKCIIVDDQTIYVTLSVEEGSLHTIDDEYIIYEEDGATYFACSEGQTVIPGEYTISIALF